jgi:hypothetical protein
VTLGAQYFSSTELQSLFALSRHYATFRSSEYPRWALAQIAILKRNAGLLSPRAFLGMQKQFEVECFIKRDNRNLRPEPQPLRRIGVGYRDKGTAAIPHQDGTPRWQEVAGNLINEDPLQEFRRKIRTECFFEALKPFQTRQLAYLG